jgi:sugar (pentulose or hexulose) kinase
VIADVLNLPVRAAPIPEATVIGATRLAALGLGRFDSIDGVTSGGSEVGRTFKPGRHNVDRYAELFSQWQAVYTVLETATAAAGLRSLKP